MPMIRSCVSLSAAAAAVLICCGGNDNSVGPDGTGGALIGTWEIEEEDGYSVIEFRSDGIAAFNEYEGSEDLTGGWVARYRVSSSTIALSELTGFSLIGDKWFAFEEAEETMRLTFSVSGGVLTTLWHEDDDMGTDRVLFVSSSRRVVVPEVAMGRFPEMEDPSASPQPTTLEGSLLITSQTDLDALTYLGDRPYSITGHLIVSETDLSSLADLGNITSIGGSLIIGDNDGLTSLEGLRNLTSIGGSLVFRRNHALTSLEDLQNIAAIAEGLGIVDNDGLTSLEGLRNLTSIGGSLAVMGNDLLTSLEGLLNLTSIGGSLVIRDNDRLTSLEGLVNIIILGEGSLDTVGSDEIIMMESPRKGSLTIEQNDALTSLEGLRGMTAIKGKLKIGSNESLSSLEGLRNLVTIDEFLGIQFNPVLPTSSAQALADRLIEGGFAGQIVIRENAGE